MYHMCPHMCPMYLNLTAEFPILLLGCNMVMDTSVDSPDFPDSAGLSLYNSQSVFVMSYLGHPLIYDSLMTESNVPILYL